MNYNCRLVRPILLAAASLLIFLYFGWAILWYYKNLQLKDVPDALEVTSVEYSLEESWGFGPGGNEAGIRTYRLPDKIATLALSGLTFFQNLPENAQGTRSSSDSSGSYYDWRETPIIPDKIRWRSYKEGQSLRAYDYICRYGFCIDVDRGVMEEVNSIINTPGSYYAYGRIGLILVNPKKRLVVYLYNG